MQLTGHRIPDPDIQKITNATALFDRLVKKPPPKKLADVLLESPDHTAARNVQMYPKRYSMIEKEESVGRWKLIERELNKKGLPHSAKP